MSSYPPNIPRCRHIKVNGTQCGSPALHHRKFCYFHTQQHREHINLYNRNRAADARVSLTLPLLEDAESVQVALMQVLRLILAGQIEPKIAGLLLCGLQTASVNLKHTHFEPVPHEEVVIDPRDVPNTALDENLWEPEQFEEDEQEEQGEEEDGEEDNEANDEDNEDEGDEEKEEDEEEAQNKQQPAEQPITAEASPSAETVALLDKALAPEATINDQLTALTSFMKDTDPDPPASSTTQPNPAQPKPPQSADLNLPFWPLKNPVMREAVAFALKLDVDDPCLNNFNLTALTHQQWQRVDAYLVQYANTH